MQKAIFPMKFMRVTQGVNGSYSHKGSMAIDLAGEDTGKCNVYSSCDAKCSYKDAKAPNGTNYWTANPVMCADGKVRDLTFRFVHDDYIGDIQVGKVYKQGTRIHNEGKSGASASHVHVIVAEGHISGHGLIKNKYGVWTLKNQLHPADVFFLYNTIVLDDGGYKWKKTDKPYVEEIKPVEPPKEQPKQDVEETPIVEEDKPVEVVEPIKKEGDTIMKKWYQSKTLWTNIIAVIVFSIQTFTGFVVPMEWQAAILGFLNMILRFATETKIGK